MIQGRGSGARESIAILQAEVLRWNRQINLVSRVETRERVAALVRQCETGWDLVREALGDVDWLRDGSYFDLGSGAGFPGLVWGAKREALGHGGPSILVEPRDKRAWFLRRTSRLMGLPRVTVWPARWGPDVEGMVAEHALVSLKALKLDDRQVIAGFPAPGDRGSRPTQIVIARFLDPGHTSRSSVEERYAGPEAGEDLGWSRGGVELLGAGNPNLLLTRYHSS